MQQHSFFKIFIIATIVKWYFFQHCPIGRYSGGRRHGAGTLFLSPGGGERLEGVWVDGRLQDEGQRIRVTGGNDNNSNNNGVSDRASIIWDNPANEDGQK